MAVMPLVPCGSPKKQRSLDKGERIVSRPGLVAQHLIHQSELLGDAVLGSGDEMQALVAELAGHRFAAHPHPKRLLVQHAALVDGLEGRKSLELISALYESIETGEEVPLHFTPRLCRLGVTS